MAGNSKNIEGKFKLIKFEKLAYDEDLLSCLFRLQKTLVQILAKTLGQSSSKQGLDNNSKL